MNFHSMCKCRLINMSDEYNVKYDVMSENEYVGSLRYCPILSEWIMRLSSYADVTFEFTVKMWTCLLSELSTTVPSVCRKCDTPLDSKGYCKDETCTFSDHQQDEAYIEG